MNTSKTLIGLTLVFVVTLLISGLMYPDSLLMAFAGVGVTFTVLRAVMIALLVGILLTNPPRSHLFRTMIGVWAVALAVTAGQLLMNYQIHMLDAVLFIEVAIILGAEALELNPAKVNKPVTRKIPVRKISVRRRITVATASS